MEEWKSILQRLKTLEECRKSGDLVLKKMNKIHGKVLAKDKMNSKVAKTLLDVYTETNVTASLEKRLLPTLIDDLEKLERSMEKKRKGDEKSGSVPKKQRPSDDEPIVTVGAQVVVKPGNDFILANVIRYRPDKEKWEVEDVDEDDGFNAKKKYLSTMKQIIVLPKPNDPNIREFPEGHTVLALYPGTTCFYKGIVMMKASANPMKEYLVRFEDDGDQDRPVKVQHCLDYPKQKKG
ncbi:DUF1325-domain-containing protein [Rhizoclosmatium globosum]|uniref:DUF1325-domain-containing protein n=1 Tax=Rhizoclosmatium globosum TaxID=329046 RepID=A0A1Y2C254_9FUNG|nr:hypothetical protein HDU79_003933 [Rhizoclosmatium sp. JEL0117]ORY41036.1 DUF1325-domain-containing protein [Rhizoclosmatium globosum]|eukprot:ORY41036.1 DUF1325-domain-containing protein [Rhizoclosmatium globosum]